MDRNILKTISMLILCLSMVNCQKEEINIEPVYSVINYVITEKDSLLLDIDKNGVVDYEFKIVNMYNESWYNYPDTFVTQIFPLNSNSLMISYYGFDKGVLIAGPWSNNNSWPAEMFHERYEAEGEKYIGIKFFIGNKKHLGWIRLSSTNRHNPLRIIDCAYNKHPFEVIHTGEK